MASCVTMPKFLANLLIGLDLFLLLLQCHLIICFNRKGRNSTLGQIKRNYYLSLTLLKSSKAKSLEKQMPQTNSSQRDVGIGNGKEKRRKKKLRKRETEEKMRTRNQGRKEGRGDSS